jgi:hypothetical protein
MSSPRIAILVADTYGEPFETIKREVHPKIWRGFENIDVFYMIGKHPTKVQDLLNKFTDNIRYTKAWPVQRLFDQLQLSPVANSLPSVVGQNSELEIDIPEGLRYLGLKFLTSIKFLSENNYDLIYKTTLSSIVNPKIFSKITQEIELKQPFYGGTLINNGNRPFVSGANLLINRSTSEIVMSSLARWNHGFLDDVALGRLLEGTVAITPIPSMNIGSLHDLESRTNLELGEVMHFRCKSSDLLRNDVEIMRKLLMRMQNAK